MDILKTLGKIGAIAAAGVGLILAGKSELGSGLFKKEDDGLNTDDLTGVPIPEQKEEQTETEVVEEVQEEEEVPE